MPTPKIDPKVQALAEKLQDEEGLTEAEANLVARRTVGGTKADVDAEVQQVIGDRVGPAALMNLAPDVPARPRLQANARLDDVESRIAAAERELAELRAFREVVEDRDRRVASQGSTTVADEASVGTVGTPIQQTQPSDVDKDANAEKKAAEKAADKDAK